MGKVEYTQIVEELDPPQVRNDIHKHFYRIIKSLPEDEVIIYITMFPVYLSNKVRVEIVCAEFETIGIPLEDCHKAFCDKMINALNDLANERRYNHMHNTFNINLLIRDAE